MVGTGRADASEAVCRWRGNAISKLPEHGLRYRMSRNPDADGIKPAGHQAGNLGRSTEHDSQRPRPKTLGESECDIWNIPRPAVDHARIGQMDNQRVIRRSPLDAEDPANSLLVCGVRTETVNGLGGKSYYAAITQK